MGINQDSLLAAYDASHTRFSSFSQKLETLIKDILRVKEVKTHVITSRTKGRESFEKKISKPGKSYSDLNDVKDICGIRIITYFEDEVDLIADIIEDEFIVDFDNSIDKRRVLNADTFGYLSLHYVCSLSDERAKLSEYSEFGAMPFEVQIRSILQHAWAEIEHDLGYKSTVAIPKEIRRRFARVAGALEGADEDFNEIKQYLRQYELNIARYITTDPTSVTIDSVSINSFITESSIVAGLDLTIAKKIGRGVQSLDEIGTDAKAWDKEPYKEHLIRGLRHVGVFTIAELELELSRLSENIVAFIETYIDYNGIFGMTQEHFKYIPTGWSVMFLPFVRIFTTASPEIIKLHNLKEYFLEVVEPDWPSDRDERATALSKRMFDSYQRLNRS